MILSVLICTHNPDYDVLRRVIASLAENLTEQATEIIVIDNASSPPVSLEVLAASSLPVRIVVESKLGSAHARLTALRAAIGSLVIFVDDDNVLKDDYLKNSLNFMDLHPEVGALGGIIEPEFATIPEPSVRLHLNLLALRNFGENEIISNWNPNLPREYPWNAPFGAGMVLRRVCSLTYIEKIGRAKHRSMGREGTRRLGGCEDAEIILYGVLEGGYQVAYSPSLRLTHVIPARRITIKYLQRLAYESGISWGEFCVRHNFAPPIPRWTLPLRLMRCYFRLKSWTSSGHLAWQTEKGRFVGRARASKTKKQSP